MKLKFIFHEKILTDSALLAVITDNYKIQVTTRNLFATGSRPRVSQHFVGDQLHQQPPIPGTAHSQLLQHDRSCPDIVRAHLVTALNPQQLCINNTSSSKAEETWRGNRQVHAQRGRRLTSFHLGLLLHPPTLLWSKPRNSTAMQKEIFICLTATTALSDVM